MLIFLGFGNQSDDVAVLRLFRLLRIYRILKVEIVLYYRKEVVMLLEDLWKFVCREFFLHLGLQVAKWTRLSTQRHLLDAGDDELPGLFTLLHC